MTEDYSKNWSWDDGVGVTPFNDWAVGQPYEEAGVPGCGVVDIHAKWSVSHCETERRSVCQKADNGLGKYFKGSIGECLENIHSLKTKLFLQLPS